MKVHKLGFALAFALLSIFASSAFALDFYGANITDKEVPSSYLNIGLVGFLPTVSDVSTDSVADKQGFKRGDIIVSINGKNIRKTSELNQLKAEVRTVSMFRNKEKMSIHLHVAGKAGTKALASENKLPLQVVATSEAQQPANTQREVAQPQEAPPQQKSLSKNAIFSRSIKPVQDQIVFENKKGKVIFSHSIHLKSLSEDQCLLCHRVESPTREYIQSRLDNHRAAHAFCRGCHQKIENAPTSDCLVCHKR